MLKTISSIKRGEVQYFENYSLSFGPIKLRVILRERQEETEGLHESASRQLVSEPVY